MKKASTYRQLTINQRRFVEERGAAFDASDWTTDYEANLFARLHSDTVADLTVAKELAADGTGGRIQAPTRQPRSRSIRSTRGDRNGAPSFWGDVAQLESPTGTLKAVEALTERDGILRTTDQLFIGRTGESKYRAIRRSMCLGAAAAALFILSGLLGL